jgi:hypothetical protein
MTQQNSLISESRVMNTCTVRVGAFVQRPLVDHLLTLKQLETVLQISDIRLSCNWLP